MVAASKAKQRAFRGWVAGSSAESRATLGFYSKIGRYVLNSLFLSYNF